MGMGPGDPCTISLTLHARQRGHSMQERKKCGHALGGSQAGCGAQQQNGAPLALLRTTHRRGTWKISRQALMETRIHRTRSRLHSHCWPGYPGHWRRRQKFQKKVTLSDGGTQCLGLRWILQTKSKSPIEPEPNYIHQVGRQIPSMTGHWVAFSTVTECH